jgi:hypothetical protein
MIANNQNTYEAVYFFETKRMEVPKKVNAIKQLNSNNRQDPKSSSMMSTLPTSLFAPDRKLTTPMP